MSAVSVQDITIDQPSADSMVELIDNVKELDMDEYYGDKKVRWFQIASCNAVIQFLSEGYRRILIKQPTGTGKTITITFTLNNPELHRILGIPDTRRMRVLFVAHKHRLLTQAERTFAEENGVDVIFQSAFSPIAQQVIDDGIDIIVIDEAHHEAMMTIQRQLMIMGDYPIIGLTATDERADGCVIKFEKIVEPITREQAVEAGFLAPTRLHSIVDPTSTNKSQIINSVLSEYIEEMGQTMVFVKTIKEANAVHEHILSLGKKSVVVSKQKESVLNAILDNFSAGGDIQFIINCNKINEGVDVKGCTDVVLGRQYGSYAQLNQVIGRAARPDCDCNVWELVNPLSGKNKDTTVIVGTPETHRLLFQRVGKWIAKEFDYVYQSSVMPVNPNPAFAA
jgi:superfamily II DNA or RNA helicase